jgi:hypothetical protein
MKRCSLFLMFSLVAAFGQGHVSGERAARLRRMPGNVAYDVLLLRGTEQSAVSTNFRFQQGDRFTLRVRVVSDSYVYLFSETPAAERNRDPGYTLIYPLVGHRVLKAGKVHLVPARSMALEIDDMPGADRLLLVVSPTKLELNRNLSGIAANSMVEDPPREARQTVLRTPAEPQLDTDEPIAQAGRAKQSEIRNPRGDVGVARSEEGARLLQCGAPKKAHAAFLIEIVLTHDHR